ncbi:MAG: FecR domain-containing protein, partial [Fibrobacter sp.]|nr:FecR domain-containing protein [Fibrobacter sp.]
SEPELTEFLTMLESDKELQGALSKEITFDSYILEQAIRNPQIENLKNEHDWNKLVTSELMVDDKNSKSFTDKEWRHLIQNSLAMAEGTKKNKFVYYPVLRYLVAACLILTVGLGIIQIITGRYKSVSLISGESTHSEKGNINPVVLTDTTSVITTEKIPGVLKFNDKSALLIQKESKILFKEKKDSVVQLEIADGTVLFNVEKGKYRRFVVSTPIVNIRVTGTIFKVTSVQGYVLVSVLEGTVEVNHCKKNINTELSIGEAIIADKDSLIETSIDLSALLPERALLLNFINRFHSVSELNNDNKNMLPCDSASSRTNKIDSIKSDPVSKSQENDFRGIILPLKNTLRAWDVLNDIEETEKTDFGKNEILEKVRVLTNQGDTTNAINLLYAGLREETNKKSGKKLLIELLSLFYAQNLIESADSVITNMYRKNNFYKEDEQIILRHAEFLKKQKLYQAAHTWYSFFLEHFPESRFKSDAYYQMWWCLIQDRASNNNRFSHLSHSDPGF